MTVVVNDFGGPIFPVEVNFWWNESGPVEAFTYDGDSYPYISVTPRPGYTSPPAVRDPTRYIMHTTFINEEVSFFAIPSPEQEAKKETFNPQVRTPAGVTVVEYLWDFGDGTVGYGPFVKHEYKLLEPGIEVKLTVVDSRGLVWSRARPVNLIPHATGFISYSLGFGHITSMFGQLRLKGSLVPQKIHAPIPAGLAFKGSLTPVKL